MKVVTHAGMFHCDDAMGAAILYILFEDLDIERTRDLEIINSYKEDKDVFVLDIGHELNHEMNNYDHHQRQGAGERDNGVAYATAGLIWKHFGHELINKMYGNEYTDLIWEHIDESIMQGIDAFDNGNLKMKTDVKIPVLPSIIGSFNPVSGQENTGCDNFLNAFWKVVEFTSDYLERRILLSHAFYSNKKMVNDAINYSENGIVVLNRGARGWQSQVLQSEKNINFCIFPSFEGTWMVHTVPEKFGSSKPKLPFPSDWAGKNGKDLDEVSGVEDTIFCHRNLFIAGHQTKAGALKMAKRAIRYGDVK